MKKFFYYLLLSCVFLMLTACGKPDSQKAFEERFKEFNKFSADFFSNVANDKNVEYVETEVNVQMQKMEDGWRITNPNELVAAILGGAASLIGL